MDRHDPNEGSVAFFQALLDNITSGKPQSVVRYGDGELSCILSARKGKLGQNYDGDLYSKPLGDAIGKSLLSPIDSENYHYCLGSHCHHIGLVRDLVKYKIWNPSINFKDAFVFVHAGINGELQKLIDYVQSNHSVLVAPEYLHDIPINFSSRVISPNNNSFLDQKNIEEKIEERISKEGHSVVLCALGMSAIPIIQSLYLKHGNSHSFLDIGSILDPYVENGKYRSHFEKITHKLTFDYDKRNKRGNRQTALQGAQVDDGGRAYNSHRRRKKASKRRLSKAVQSNKVA